MAEQFTRFARRASSLAGHCRTVLAAVALIISWAISGPLFGFSETWQLVINTCTTITVLMVFLIRTNRTAMP